MCRSLRLRNLAGLLVALGSACAGAALAWHHPVWPLPASVMFAAWCLVVAWRPGLWLLLVPALLPLMNFSPWTGWVVFEEFDLLLLGALAGGYGRLVGSMRSGVPTRSPQESRRSIALAGLCALLGVQGLVALGRGFADAGGFAFDWFAGYTEALNSLRVFKSLGFALLFAPLLHQEMIHDAALSSRRLASGMVCGLAVVTLAALWERLAFPGLLDFSQPYRTVALFWEMHVGGAAIDAYLAMAAPFAVWALISARRPAVWVAAGVLALLTGYACLTTFSRGVYLAVGVPLLLLGVARWTHRGRRYRLEHWRAMASAGLLLALIVEVAAVLSGGSFMRARLNSVDQDLRSRTAHWLQGLELLEGPADWLLGIGLGRLPANYAANFTDGEFPGAVTWREERSGAAPGNAFVTVRGPATRTRLGGGYALTQRVARFSNGPYRVSLEVRAPARADIHLALCERHLLYDGHCQTAVLRLMPGPREWQHHVVALTGAALAGSRWYAPRLRMFSVSVVNAGGLADFDNLRLIDPDSTQWLDNGSFHAQLAHWLPAAQSYFVPWHIDNLFVEVLVERGALGLLLLAALIATALWRLAQGGAAVGALSAYLAASLTGALLVGLISSIMDVPRVAFMFYLLALFSIESSPPRNRHFNPTRPLLDG